MIRTAVILAARREAEGRIPYPLQEFAPETTLLRRSLELLHELGITQCYLVVGYQAELFEPYRSSWVTLVENDQYAFSASMASLACVAPYLQEDFLLLEGDTFYERRVLEELLASPRSTCLCVASETGSGDEAFVELQEGFLTKVSKDRHQITHFSGELLGILRLSYETYQRMCTLWQRSDNPYLNYEYVLLDVTQPLERPVLCFKDLLWGDVDCDKDLERLSRSLYPRLRRKEDPFDEQNLRERLQEIFPQQGSDYPWQIAPLGGMSNKNFLVRDSQASYVLRIPGLGAEGMVDRAQEEHNDKLASALALTPSLRYFNPRNGVKLSDFITGAETMSSASLQRPEHLRQIAQLLRTLHGSAVRFDNDFNVFQELRRYEQLLAQAGGTAPEGYQSLRETIFALQSRLNTLGIQLAPCHNDLVAENFIKDHTGRLYLIDWEYSGMNDPLWDVAALFLESEFTAEAQDFFLQLYLGISPSEQVREKVAIYQVLMDILWSLWTCVKEARGDDFGSYGVDRYRRGVSLLEQLRKEGACV